MTRLSSFEETSFLEDIYLFFYNFLEWIGTLPMPIQIAAYAGVYIGGCIVVLYILAFLKDWAQNFMRKYK